MENTTNHETSNIYMRFHPDYAVEIMRRYNAAKFEGREYVVDAAEAKSLIAKLGDRHVTSPLKEDLELIKEARGN